MNRITLESLFLKRVSLIRGPPWWQWLINVTSIMEVIMYENILTSSERNAWFVTGPPELQIPISTTYVTLWSGQAINQWKIYPFRMPDYLYWKNVIPVFHLQPATFIILPFAFYSKHVLHIPWDQDIVPRMRLDVKLPKVLSLEEIEKLINSATQIRNKAIIACFIHLECV